MNNFIRASDGAEVSFLGTNGNVIGNAGTAGDGEPGSGGPLDTRRIVATDTTWGRTSTSVTEDTTWQSVHTMRATGANLEVTWAGPMDSGTHTLAAALEMNGIVTQLTFGGATRGTVSTDQTLTCDPVSLTLGKGTEFRVRTFAAAGSLIQTQATGNFTRGTQTPGDLTVPGSGPLTIRNDLWRGQPIPLLITGETSADTVAVFGVGDSIMEGGSDSQDIAPSKFLGPGYFTRSMEAGKHPWAKSGNWVYPFPVGVQRDARFGTSGHLLSAATHILCEYGGNNFSNTYSALQAVAVSFWTYAADHAKVYQVTKRPNSTSTDGWTTVEGQIETATAANRELFNAWLRDGAPIIAGVGASTGTTEPEATRAGTAGHPLAGCLEVESLAQHGSTNLWRIDMGPLTADGTHPNAKGHQIMMLPLQAWDASLIAP